MNFAIFVNDSGLPIAIPGVHACAQNLRSAGHEVGLVDYFEGDPVDLLAALPVEDPLVVVLWRANNFTDGVPALETWWPKVDQRAQAIKAKFRAAKVVVTGWLAVYEQVLRTVLPGAAIDAAFVSGYEFDQPLQAWLTNPAEAAVIAWPEQAPVRKRTLAARGPLAPWPGRYIMATPPLCDRLCRKCPTANRCLREQLDTAPGALSAMLDEFKQEVRDCASSTESVFAVTTDIGFEPEVLTAIQESAREHPHLRWYLNVSLHAGLPQPLLDQLLSIPLGGVSLWCPTLVPESMVSLGLPPLDLVADCHRLADRLAPDTFLEISAYVGLPGDSPALIECSRNRLLQSARIDIYNPVPLFLDTNCALFQEGHYTVDVGGGTSLFGRPGWHSHAIDSHWVRQWERDSRPSVPQNAPLAKYLLSFHYLFNLVMNGFTSAELRGLRQSLRQGNCDAVQVAIAARGKLTQHRLAAWHQP